MLELRRREHARSLGVLVSHRGHIGVRRERGEFTGGRDDLPDGQGSRLFGGRDDGLSPPEPAWPTDEQEIQQRLVEFASWLGDEVLLQHRVVATARCVSVGGGPTSVRSYTVFALTGTADAGVGRTLPIGLSGRGNGLDVLADRAVADAIRWTRAALSAAEGPVCGSPPAVLSTQAAAVLTHESVGHYAEAVHVGAPAVHRLHTRIAAECLSAVDDSEVDADDEGVRCLGPTQLLHRGVLVAQLHSRATARAAAASPTGNARAATVWDPPIPRVSRLVCAAGQRSEAALVRRLDTGVYIHRLADGHRHGTRIAAHVVLGEHVVHGHRTGRFFTGGQVDGRLDLLTDLVELADRVEPNPNAMCGKDGQLLFDVFTAAPAMRLSALRLTA